MCPYLCVSPVGRVEAGLAVGRGERVSRPSRIPAAQIAIKVGPENATDAVECHGVDARVQETAKSKYFYPKHVKVLLRRRMWRGFFFKNINRFCRTAAKSKCKLGFVLKCSDT